MFLENIPLLISIIADFFLEQCLNMPGTVLNALHIVNISFNLYSNDMRVF